MATRAKPGKKAAAPKSAHLDPTSDEALRARPIKFAEPPDMPVAIQVEEWGALHRLAASRAAAFARIGISRDTIDSLKKFAARLGQLETAWQKQRAGVKLSAKERKLLAEAEALDSKLLAGGRWALRGDEAAQAELNRIAEGSGLTDTVADLRDEVTFWSDHQDELAHTDITAADLKRATELANALDEAAQKEAANADAADTLELRNRCFWAGDLVSKDVREGGRYLYREQPKLASKFTSRYRLAAANRSRRKAKDEKAKKEKSGPTDDKSKKDGG